MTVAVCTAVCLIACFMLYIGEVRLALIDLLMAGLIMLAADWPGPSRL